ncbi:helix-turn-helix transcriptional regulator [Paenibacillus alvei]|nr:helix-turn-helix transcriptional regulator [Paenibacillus alvei]MEC0083065.1 helix-turn-helix transcriptional regulator [Paenibacillus alvei]
MSKKRITLTQKRNHYGYTRETFANEIQMSKESVKSLEYGRMNPSAKTMLIICKVLDSTPEELFPDISNT